MTGEEDRLIGMIIRDVTARYESEARPCELASLDMLTRLASRSAFMESSLQKPPYPIRC